MKHNTFRLKTLAALAIGLGLSACSFQHSQDNCAQNAAKPKPSLLFVIHAQNGQLTQQKQQFQLQLQNPRINYFTDRPYRKSGYLTPQQYLIAWKGKYPDGFRSDPPNASLAGLNYLPGHKLDVGTATETNALVEVNNSVWDAKTHTLRMNIRALNQTTLSAGSLDDVTLFVDNFNGFPGFDTGGDS